MARKPRTIALVWSQFTDPHVDRCNALAARLEGRARVIPIEVASTSATYADFTSGAADEGAGRITLFPDRSFDEIPRWRRFIALIRAVRGCDTVYIGVPYSEIDFLVAAWLLRIMGRRVVLMCDSKFDDFPRSVVFENLKRLGLSCYSAVMVAGARGQDYFRFLGFGRRPILIGYDTLSTDRVRRLAGLASDCEVPAFAARDFVYVGRFIPKKGLATLIAAFARFCELAPESKRKLIMIGTGPLEPELRQQVSALGLGERVEFTGFMEGSALYRRMARALALVFVSYREQWGLVLNEATALGLPLIVSEAPGAGDLLARNLVNGFVLENASVEGIALAMQDMARDEDQWHRMSAASRELAPFGDCALFADAIELTIDEQAQPAGQRIAACVGQFPILQHRPQVD